MKTKLLKLTKIRLLLLIAVSLVVSIGVVSLLSQKTSATVVPITEGVGGSPDNPVHVDPNTGEGALCGFSAAGCFQENNGTVYHCSASGCTEIGSASGGTSNSTSQNAGSADTGQTVNPPPDAAQACYTGSCIYVDPGTNQSITCSNHVCTVTGTDNVVNVPGISQGGSSNSTQADSVRPPAGGSQQNGGSAQTGNTQPGSGDLGGFGSIYSGYAGTVPGGSGQTGGSVQDSIQGGSSGGGSNFLGSNSDSFGSFTGELPNNFQNYSFCGDNICSAAYGESSSSCSLDCGVAQSATGTSSTPSKSPAFCGIPCDSDAQCAGDRLVCFQGVCRNPSCTSDSSCLCGGTSGDGTSPTSGWTVTPTTFLSPQVQLSANPINIPHMGFTTLKWTSQNATICKSYTNGGFTNWSGGYDKLSGQLSIGPLTTDTAFSMQCDNGAVSSPMSLVTVNVASPTTAQNTATPTTVGNSPTPTTTGGGQCNACNADVDGSGTVDQNDILAIQKCMISMTAGAFCAKADINKDGKVDASDLACAQGLIGQKCGGTTNSPTPTTTTTSPQAAVMTIPEEDGDAVRNTQTFRWTAGKGAQGYKLEIGNTKGGNNFLNKDFDANTLTTKVTNLIQGPSEGLIYVKLTTKLPTGNVSNEYVYQAFQLEFTCSSTQDLVAKWKPLIGATSYSLNVSNDKTTSKSDKTSFVNYPTGIPLPYFKGAVGNVDTYSLGKGVIGKTYYAFVRSNTGINSDVEGVTCASPTGTPSPVATATQQPTTPPGNMKLNLTLELPGIGSENCIASPSSTFDRVGNNCKPKSPNRSTTVEVFNAQDQKVANAVAQLTFDGDKYKGTASFDVSNGSYSVIVGMNNTLKKRLPGIQNLNTGITNQAPSAQLTSGDLDRNNILDLFDWNILIDCFDNPGCGAEFSLSDLNDDGKVEEIDVNILSRGFAIRDGDEIRQGTTPTPTPTGTTTNIPTPTGTTATATPTTAGVTATSTPTAASTPTSTPTPTTKTNPPTATSTPSPTAASAQIKCNNDSMCPAGMSCVANFCR